MNTTLIQSWTVGDICKGFQYNEYEGKGSAISARGSSTMNTRARVSTAYPAN